MTRKSTNVRGKFGWREHVLRLGFRALRPWPEMSARWAEALFFSPPRPPRTARMPASAVRHDVYSRGTGPLAAWRSGQGPLVYLLHGWGGSAAQLRGWVAPLVAEGFSVVAFDAPGHGASGGRRSSIPEFARALQAVVAQHGPAEAVVAHSLGGAALALAMRDGLPVRRAVLVGPPADPVSWTRAFAARLRVGPAALARLQQRTERRLQMRWSDLHVPSLVRSFAVPALVVHDRDDREVPWRDGAHIASCWPEARLVTTTGLGHRRILQDPGVARSIASFVAGCRAGEVPACPECGSPRGPGPGAPCRACAFERYLFNREGRGVAMPA
jgi:pimeloyl-ACP methyl ester carboxylesterase